MAAELPEGWPQDKPMAVCVNIPLEWWEDGVSPGTAPQANPLRGMASSTPRPSSGRNMP